MRQQAVFDLERVDVLPPADDQVFDAAGDGDVAVGVQGGFVTGLDKGEVGGLVGGGEGGKGRTYVHPDFAGCVGEQDFGCAFWGSPVFFHD